jgi:NADH:ubiquinone oxidoreductase subunit E
MTDTAATAPCIDREKTRRILERYPEKDRTGLIHALQDVQSEYGYVPCEAVEEVCRHLDVPIARAFSVATFYKAFSLEPKGDTIIRICTGTACHIRGAKTLVDEVCTALDVEPGRTTKDLKYTVETVNCVGACAMAPVVSIDGKYHGGVKPGFLKKTVKRGK